MKYLFLLGILILGVALLIDYSDFQKPILDIKTECSLCVETGIEYVCGCEIVNIHSTEKTVLFWILYIISIIYLIVGATYILGEK